MHSGMWEAVADILFWLQLLWVFAGFLLMAYLGWTIFPEKGKRAAPVSTRGSSEPASHQIELGGYRFEIPIRYESLRN